MKINIYHPPINLKREFDPDDLKFLQILEEDTDLQSLLIRFREKAGLLKEGFDLNKSIVDYQKIGAIKKINFDKLIKSAEILSCIWNLPPNWVITFISLLLFNIATPPEKFTYQPIEIIYRKSEILIRIREKTTRKRIKEFIDKNKRFVDKKLLSLPYTRHIKIKNIDLMKKIYKLKTLGKTDKQIMNEPDVYPLSYEELAIYRKRYSQYLKKYLSKDWREAFIHLQYFF